MFTQVLAAALGFIAIESLDAPEWLTDYSAAREVCVEKHKPIAVFIGEGKEGWNQVSKKQELPKETKKLLASKYVCVYINLRDRDGKRLASEFAVKNGPALVISDSAGKKQAFRHEGDLKTKELMQNLEHHSDPSRTVRRTRTLASRGATAVRKLARPLSNLGSNSGHSC
jgi:hypothetical protein